MAFTTTAQVIIDEAEAILQDTSNDFWAATELLSGVNLGCKEVCLHKPDAYVVSASVTLAAGIVQELPTAGHQLMDVLSNMGTTPGTTQGAVIRRIERKVLDAMDPGWATVTASATVIYYMYDERYPRQFLVYPRQPSSGFGFVQMLYAAAPAEIAADAAILIPDIYRPALTQYVLYYAHAKESDRGTQNLDKAAAYYQAFLNALGVKQEKERSEDPNVR